MRRRVRTARISIPLLLLVASGCTRPRPQHRAPVDDLAPAPVVVGSNVLRRDYAGSPQCAHCHQAIYDAWLQSPMHRMTRDADTAEIRAPFSGGEFRFKGDRVTMETLGDQRFMRIHTRAGGESLYRITRVIGGRYREDFVGVVVGDGDAGQGVERVMPVSYVFDTDSWRYKGYSVLVKERPRLSAGGVWRQNCIFCHNTIPHLSTLFDELRGDRQGGYQGSMSNDVLPNSRRWQVSPKDEAALVRALGEEIDFLGGAGAAATSLSGVLAEAMEVTRARFGPEHFVEIGIGCESCHGGSREHVDDPRRRPTFEVRSDVVEERPRSSQLQPSRAQWINRTCMRCHTVLFTRYAHTWEGGHRYRNAGGSNVNSGEARDFALGGCATELGCTSCHDPHAQDDPGAHGELLGDAGKRLCTSCHAGLSSHEAVRSHTHHDPAGPGSSCVGCHMPRKNLGLAYRLTRYHRIGTPADRARVEGDRPLECALCHADQSVAWAVETMERWWGRSYDRDRLSRLYGDDLTVEPLRATLRRGKPHERAVAAAVLGDANARAAAREIAALLADPYPLVRYFAAQALADIYGEWPAVDLNADTEAIVTQTRRWLLANE